jgi:hypothetical protein
MRDNEICNFYLKHFSRLLHLYYIYWDHMSTAVFRLPHFYGVHILTSRDLLQQTACGFFRSSACRTNLYEASRFPSCSLSHRLIHCLVLEFQPWFQLLLRLCTFLWHVPGRYSSSTGDVWHNYNVQNKSKNCNKIISMNEMCDHAGITCIPDFLQRKVSE